MKHVPVDVMVKALLVELRKFIVFWQPASPPPPNRLGRV